MWMDAWLDGWKDHYKTTMSLCLLACLPKRSRAAANHSCGLRIDPIGLRYLPAFLSKQGSPLSFMNWLRLSRSAVTLAGPLRAASRRGQRGAEVQEGRRWRLEERHGGTSTPAARRRALAG